VLDPDSEFHWRDLALCAFLEESEQDLFVSDREIDQLQAQQFCANCPVIEDCFWFAVDTKTRTHVWGGLLPAQRTKLLKAVARTGYSSEILYTHVESALSWARQLVIALQRDAEIA